MAPVTETALIAGRTRSNTTKEGLLAGAQGQELLAALFGFIQPILCASASVSTASVHLEDDRSKFNLQDRRLLTALKDFVKTTLSVRGGAEENINSEQDTKTLIETQLPLSPTASFKFPSPEEVLTANIMKPLSFHVYNNMPIRLLSFDIAGLAVRLVERNEVIKIVFRRAFAEARTEKFQEAYNQPMDDLTHKMLLLERLVEKHSKYAILSHTWIRDTPGDVIFQDWNTRSENTRGYSKIAKFCQVAANNYNVAFGWMDTVCINKESSSELDESIRSMYKWYQQAHVCVAYLSETENLDSMQRDSWFTRGWTLQELLAPRSLDFYNRNWVTFRAMNTSADFSIEQLIQKRIQNATTITAEEIGKCRLGRPDLLPISRKFQLAANRRVTRSEDQAYSLMGLLDVDISVAYGEGAERALYRLQREILTTKRNPLDIFNCSLDEANTILPSSFSQYCSRSTAFDCNNEHGSSTLDLWTPAEPLLCTHLGVRLQVLLIPGLLRDAYGQKTPTSKGNFHGIARVILCNGSNYIYSLLDKDIFTKNDTGQRFQDPLHINRICTAVMNFTVKGNAVMLPETCLAVALDCGATSPGSAEQSDFKRARQVDSVVPFQLQSKNGESRVAMKDLVRNGMQIITVYL